MRPGLTLSDEKKAAEGYSSASSGGPEVERLWGLPLVGLGVKVTLAEGATVA